MYDIAIVSLGEARKTRTFRLRRSTLLALGLLGFAVSVAVTLAALMFTPLALYVPIPNPGLEARYGRKILETQQQLAHLAEEMLTLKGYNIQLRKALGEGGDTLRAKNAIPQTVETQAPPRQHAAAGDAGLDTYESSAAGGIADEYGAPVSLAQAVRSADPVRLPLMMPAEGFITQGFDPERGHYGMDIAGKRGSVVSASADGRVVFAGWTYDDGNMIVVSHDAGYVTIYKHNQTLLKPAQSSVRRGEPIAYLGTSGRTSEGPHLHFEVWKDGGPRNPAEYLLRPHRLE
jgi:murein DD-endopeptidase MepM/ murein hydrolase activator NlpD